MEQWAKLQGSSTVRQVIPDVFPSSSFFHSYVFGWGRRFCPGHDIAESSLFIVLSRILWAFDLKTRKHPVTGADDIPDMNDESSFTDGFVSIPKIYPLAFIPRSEKKASMIRKAFADAQDQWELLGMEPDQR